MISQPFFKMLRRYKRWWILVLVVLVTFFFPLTRWSLGFQFWMFLLGGYIALKTYWFIPKKTRNWSPFSLKILGVGLDVLGIILLGLGCPNLAVLLDFVNQGISWFLIALGFGLVLVGGRLALSFKMKSGTIIWHGRA